METYRLKRGADGRERVEVRLRGPQLLNHPMYNHSTAFTPEERRDLGLEGLLPDVVSTLEQQVKRAYGFVTRRTDPLERYVGLVALQDRNEHLFFRLLVENLEELLPIVYTPTVGQACQHYSRIFRRSRGLWITPEHRGRMTEVLTNAPYEDVRLIVVTDNERVLGLGDQGAGGMALSLGRLALYVAAGGIHPAQTLPISLDVGTDNQSLLEDELYIGWPHPRLRGRDYESVVDEFVRAVKLRFPRALLQWEDLEPHNATRFLERYRGELPSFNDDLQGTAAVALAGLFSAGRATGTKLSDQRVVIAGSGPAGVGVARLLREALEREGVPEEALRRSVALMDPAGLLVEADGDLRDLSWPGELASAHGLEGGSDLNAVVRALRPTALVGVSDVHGLFSEGVVREMARHVERPAILPLSRPTSEAEARPADLRAWTDGRALVATRRVHDGVESVEDGRAGRADNAFIFPGLALGALASEAREVTDGLFVAAAEALAEQVAEAALEDGALFPPLARLREVSTRVAEAVAREAARQDITRTPPRDPAEAVAAARWEPAYPVVEIS